MKIGDAVTAHAKDYEGYALPTPDVRTAAAAGEHGDTFHIGFFNIQGSISGIDD